MKNKFLLKLLAIITVLSLAITSVVASELPTDESQNEPLCEICGCEEDECTCDETEGDTPPITSYDDPFPGDTIY